MVFPVVMYQWKSWTIKKAERQRIDACELWGCRRLLGVPWTARDPTSQYKGHQSWIFIGKTNADAETPALWPPDSKNWLIGKDPDAGKDWGQGQKGTTEDEMVGWHHWLSGHEFEQTLRDSEDREAWRSVVHGVATTRTRLIDWKTQQWSICLGKMYLLMINILANRRWRQITSNNQQGSTLNFAYSP